jgi:hypothetical protein
MRTALFLFIGWDDMSLIQSDVEDFMRKLLRPVAEDGRMTAESRATYEEVRFWRDAVVDACNKYTGIYERLAEENGEKIRESPG